MSTIKLTRNNKDFFGWCFCCSGNRRSNVLVSPECLSVGQHYFGDGEKKTRKTSFEKLKIPEFVCFYGQKRERSRLTDHAVRIDAEGLILLKWKLTRPDSYAVTHVTPATTNARDCASWLIRLGTSTIYYNMFLFFWLLFIYFFLFFLSFFDPKYDGRDLLGPAARQTDDRV